VFLFESISGVESGEPVSAVKSGSYELFISNRRPVTEDEIKNAFALAQAERTEDGLVIVMRPSHVYKRFFVVLILFYLFFVDKKNTFNICFCISQNQITSYGKTQCIL